MNVLQRYYGSALLIMLAISFVTLIAADLPKSPVYSASQKEFYLESKDLAFIRPGLQIEIQNAAIAGDTAKVSFRIADDKGQPLDRDGVTTPGVVSLNFVFARIQQGERQYTAYTTRMQPNPTTGELFLQATRDSGGSYSGGPEGVYTYTFGTRIPAAG